jgi:hypothetical protein
MPHVANFRRRVNLLVLISFDRPFGLVLVEAGASALQSSALPRLHAECFRKNVPNSAIINDYFPSPYQSIK